ncbi:serine-rich adhesin for platelets isoform X1 [Nilaparvata lugens]|uniref:serine-rich adhesin for platelets isoform X1 n=1 Tax=Nilaparvata lugens TaxID=108931 RepID=UPI00193D1A90|nr:serine-rich adhesin for platelets isoform X1 [Nilaparvata lugens]
MDEFDEDMLAQLSPILSSKTFKKPEDRKVIGDNKNGVVEIELSPILSQSRKKSSKTSGIKVGGYSGVPKSSSTPKCVKKDLFQDRFRSLSKPNHRLSSVEEVGVCSKGDKFEENLEDLEDFEGIVGLDEILAQSKCDEVSAKSNVVENQEDIDDDFEGIVGLDEILAQSKFDEENDATVVADPERSPSPKTLSYYYTGDNLYNVSQLVEIAMRLRAQGKEMNKKNIAEVRRTYDIEIGRNVEKGKQKTDGKSENNIGEENQNSDEFILNSSDDDLFDCADSKIDLNYEAMKYPGSVKHENVPIINCEQSLNQLMNDSKQSVNGYNQSVNDSKPSEDKSNQSVNVPNSSVNESNQRVNDSMKSIPDNNSKPTTSKNYTNENNLEISQEALDNDEDYFEITGLDELMQKCSDNPENSKSNQIGSKPPAQSKVRSDLEIDSEEDELLKNCVDDALMNSFENIEAQAVSTKPAVQTENSNTLKYESESCQSKYFSGGLTSKAKLINYKTASKIDNNTEVGNIKLQSENSKSNKEGILKQVTKSDPSNTVNHRSTSETFANTVVSSKLKPENGKLNKKEAATQITNPPNKPLCSTQFKSDYLSNEELEELLKSGMFSDSPVEVSAAKPETSIDVLDLTENDPDIIDNSNELHMESPLILSYGNRSAKVAGSITRNKSKNDNSLQNSTKFSLLSKSKSKGGLSLGKGTQSKLNFASGSKEKELKEFSGGKRTDIGSRNYEKDEILSLGTPVVKLTRLESMGTTVSTSGEKISGEFSFVDETMKENLKKQQSSCSWGLPDLKETRHSSKDNNKLMIGNSGKISSVVSPVVKCIRLDNMDTDLKKSDDGFSWGSSDTVKISAQKIKHDLSFSSQSSERRPTVNEFGQKIKHDTSCRSLDTVKISGNEAKHNELDGQTCLGVEKDGKTRSLEDSFSWETRETRGCGGENVDEKSCEKKSSVIEISDDSFYPGERHRQQRKPLVISSGSDQEKEDIFPTISTAKQSKFGGKIDRSSTSSVSRKSTSFKARKSSDTDDSSDIFITSVNKPADKSLNDSEAVPSRRKGGKNKKAKNKKPNAFIESEADVSGDETSSGRETSGLDSMDESFVDDQVNNDNTMMVAHYLQTVKTPKKVAGGYRIPELSESVMARDVYSQYVPMEHETYVNDSFCVGNETGTNESEMSELELAEKLLAKRKKDRKHKKKAKRKRKKSSSESVGSSSQESRRNEQIEGKKEEKKKKKKRRIVILDDSSD